MNFEKMSDSEVLKSVNEGHKERAFETLYKRYHQNLSRFLEGLSGDKLLSEDLSQDTFLELDRFLEDHKSDTNFKSWLFTVAKNKYINFYRRDNKKLIQNFDIGLVDDGLDFVSPNYNGVPNPEELEIAREKYSRLRRYVGKLPKNLSSVVELYYLRGFKGEEVAEIIGCPYTTVRSRLFEARKILSKKMKRYQ